MLITLVTRDTSYFVSVQLTVLALLGVALCFKLLTVSQRSYYSRRLGFKAPIQSKSTYKQIKARVVKRMNCFKNKERRCIESAKKECNRRLITRCITLSLP